MNEHEHEHDTEGTGDATTAGADVPEQPEATADTSTATSSTGEAEGEAEAVQSMFGGLGPAEASRRRWERERQFDPSNPSRDPRVKMAQNLQSKAEKGDVKAYELWRRLTDELEAERLARDHADGAGAWEEITPEQRRLLLSILRQESVVLQGDEAEEWKRWREKRDGEAAAVVGA